MNSLSLARYAWSALMQAPLGELDQYVHTRARIERSNPTAASMSKSFAFLLVAFAFAVRLTRTTLEVSEWHT